MPTDEILYTDGADIVVTPSTFLVRNKSYKLTGIIRHGFTTIRPERLPGIIILLLGVALIICGAREVISSSVIPDMLINEKLLTANTLALWGGGVLVALGILMTFIVKERYAVRISTAEGEKNAVISTQREYIKQIVNALNRAVLMMDPKSMRVSG